MEKGYTPTLGRFFTPYIYKASVVEEKKGKLQRKPICKEREKWKRSENRQLRKRKSGSAAKTKLQGKEKVENEMKNSGRGNKKEILSISRPYPFHF